MASDSGCKDVNCQAEIEPLTGKPYFDIILCRSSVKPATHLVLPTKFHQYLPFIDVPTVLAHSGKNWQMNYLGSARTHKRLDLGWRAFVNDNNLNAGDACVFELMECSNKLIEFKVQILRGDIPSCLSARTCGETLELPIVID